MNNVYYNNKIYILNNNTIAYRLDYLTGQKAHGLSGVPPSNNSI